MSNGNDTKITPDELLSVYGFSPADNTEDVPTALPWKSKLIGQQIRSLFDYKSALDSVGKDMWMTAHNLIVNTPDDQSRRKFISLSCNLSIQHDLQKEITKLLAHSGRIIFVHGS